MSYLVLGLQQIKEQGQRLSKVLNETDKVLDAQGNLSSAQRSQLIKEFADVENHGGFATENGTMANYDLLVKILSLLGNKTGDMNR
jgi:hypothetical protein